MAKLPSKLELKKLPIDELVSLHSNVNEVLQARAESESNELEEKLKRLQPFRGGSKSSVVAVAPAAPVAKKVKKRGRPKKQKVKAAKAVEAAPAVAPEPEVVASEPVSKRRGRPKGSMNKKPVVAKKIVKKSVQKPVKVEIRKATKKSPGTRYVDPATNNVWAGRGRTPKWLVELERKGHKRSEFLK